MYVFTLVSIDVRASDPLPDTIPAAPAFVSALAIVVEFASISILPTFEPDCPMFVL